MALQQVVVRSTWFPQYHGENRRDAIRLTLYGLPTPISLVNSFHDRGYGPFAPETLIIVGSNLQDQQLNFENARSA
jgi:hypothetical protein